MSSKAETQVSKESPRKHCAIILSHGRPDNVLTAKLLKSVSYDGPVYILVDDQDPTIEEYRKRYGDNVIVFDKEAAAAHTDAGINSGYRKSVLFARNVVHRVVSELGYTHFVMLDDDYGSIQIRFDQYGHYHYGGGCYRGAELIEMYFRFLDETPALCVCLAQGGDFIGGKESTRASKGVALWRKAMNVYFCRTDRPFAFTGIMNDDVNTYVDKGSRGELFLTAPNAMINQAQTQTSAGGLTDMYKEYGTYVKSFYTVIYQPSCAFVSVITSSLTRLHHKINWINAVPSILAERHRKGEV